MNEEKYEQMIKRLKVTCCKKCSLSTDLTNVTRHVKRTLLDLADTVR